MSRITCGCSRVVQRIDDGKDLNFAGECEECVRNAGRYDRSKAWKELQSIPPTTLEKVRDKFNDEEIERPAKPKKSGSPTLHHVLPQSRGGQDYNNLVTIPEKFHQALHTLFGNLTVQESLRFFEEVVVPGKKWTNAQLEQLRTQIKEKRR